MDVSAAQVLAFRFAAQELHVAGPRPVTEPAVLDIGVQDTGPDGAGWALVNRGVEPTAAADPDGALVLVWTVRGAPHLYRRSEVAAVAAATAPYSSADAAKRIFDAARPLKQAGIDPRDALAVVAGHLRDIVSTPMVKGEMSSRLTERVPEPYLRYCRPCEAVHVYEQPFRLSALPAGLELQPGTSPPVLQPIPRWQGAAEEAPESLDLVRACLRFLGPATPAMVASYLDAPVQDVKARWPRDTAEVRVDGERRSLVTADLPALESAAYDSAAVRLLGPFDLFLQARDRDLLVPEEDRRKALWRTLGRPGGVVAGGRVVGTWRPRASGRRLRVAVERWHPVDEAAMADQAERLAAYRGVTFAGFTDA